MTAKRAVIGLVGIIFMLLLAGGASGTGTNAFLYPVAYLGEDERLALGLAAAGATVGASPGPEVKAVIFDECPNQEVGQALLKREILVASVKCSAVDLLKALGGAELIVQPFVPTLIAEGFITDTQAAETQATLAAQTAAEALKVAASAPGYGALVHRWTRVHSAIGRVSHYLDIAPFGPSVEEMVMRINLSMEDLSTRR